VNALAILKIEIRGYYHIEFASKDIIVMLGKELLKLLRLGYLVLTVLGYLLEDIHYALDWLVLFVMQ